MDDENNEDDKDNEDNEDDEDNEDNEDDKDNEDTRTTRTTRMTRTTRTTASSLQSVGEIVERFSADKRIPDSISGAGPAPVWAIVGNLWRELDPPHRLRDWREAPRFAMRCG